MAIHRDDAKIIQLPEYPPIKLVYFSAAQYQEGIVELSQKQA